MLRRALFLQRKSPPLSISHPSSFPSTLHLSLFLMVHADFIPLFSLLASSGRNLDSNHTSPCVSGAHPKTYTSPYISIRLRCSCARNGYVVTCLSIFVRTKKQLTFVLVCLVHVSHVLLCDVVTAVIVVRLGTRAVCLAPLTNTAVEPCYAAAQQWSGLQSVDLCRSQ